MSHRRAPSLLLLIASTLLAGCGHAKPLAPATPGPAATAASVATREAANGPSDVIRRSAIRGVLAAGLGAFLQKVSVDDHPVFSAGKFHGFRITALEAESFRGVDLQPGDVVTLIDGMPIEHPEEAIAAFNALEVASELRVDYERDGVPRTLRYRILDDDPPASTPPAAPAKPGK